MFLIVAGAALVGSPCPSDATVAALCGQHAPGRARSRIRHLEKSGHFVLRVGLSGSRAIVLPDLGWETGWSDLGGDAETCSFPRSSGTVRHRQPVLDVAGGADGWVETDETDAA